MNRRIALIGLACLSLLLATGSGAFSAMSADRSVDVTVVDDSEAYIAIGDTLQCGQGNNAGNKNFVRNQFGTTIETLTLRFTVPQSESGELRVGQGGSVEQIGVGDATTITERSVAPGGGVAVKILPPKQGTASIDALTVEVVEASGDGVEVSVGERRIDVHCTPGSETASGDNQSGQ
jgi:hypothetical protein